MSKTSDAFDTIKQAMADNPDYAWSWHCNLAMAFHDEGMDHHDANLGAARFLYNTFGISTYDQVNNYFGIVAPKESTFAEFKEAVNTLEPLGNMLTTPINFGFSTPAVLSDVDPTHHE